MARSHNTDSRGGAFPSQVILSVWSKGSVVPGQSPAMWRTDLCGALMRYSDYGNIYSQYGWEVDHILPVARGGGDELSNLQPLQWANNRQKGDTFPWYCK